MFYILVKIGLANTGAAIEAAAASLKVPSAIGTGGNSARVVSILPRH